MVTWRWLYKALWLAVSAVSWKGYSGG